MNRTETTSLLITLCSIYPASRIEVTEPMVEAWHKLLANTDYKQLTSRLDKLNGRMFPSAIEVKNLLLVEKQKEKLPDDYWL